MKIIYILVVVISLLFLTGCEESPSIIITPKTIESNSINNTYITNNITNNITIGGVINNFTINITQNFTNIYNYTNNITNSQTNNYYTTNNITQNITNNITIQATSNSITLSCLNITGSSSNLCTIVDTDTNDSARVNSLNASIIILQGADASIITNLSYKYNTSDFIIQNTSLWTAINLRTLQTDFTTQNTSTWNSINANGNGTGNITNNAQASYIPQIQNASQLNNSVIYQNGINIGIGVINTSTTTTAYNATIYNGNFSYGMAQTTTVGGGTDTGGVGAKVVATKNNSFISGCSAPGLASGTAPDRCLILNSARTSILYTDTTFNGTNTTTPFQYNLTLGTTYYVLLNKTGGGTWSARYNNTGQVTLPNVLTDLNYTASYYNGDVTSQVRGILSIQTNSYNNSVTTTSGPSPMSMLEVNGNFTANKTFYVQTNGKIGINNSNPTYNLDVNGQVHANDYYSNNGTQGWTGTCTIVGLTSIRVANGLITGCS